MLNLLFFSGSSRQNSLNKKLILAAEKSLDKNQINLTIIDLADYDIPLYNGDFEDANGIPADVKKLKAIFDAQDGILIASPEYNGTYSALLKNTVDWLTRNKADGLTAFRGKVIALCATSPGPRGALGGLTPLRMLMGGIGSFVIPTQMALGNGGNAFGEDGNLVDEKNQTMLNGMLNELVETATSISN